MSSPTHAERERAVRERLIRERIVAEEYGGIDPAPHARPATSFTVHGNRTWSLGDPSSWNLPQKVAMLAAGLVMLVALGLMLMPVSAKAPGGRTFSCGPAVLALNDRTWPCRDPSRTRVTMGVVVLLLVGAGGAGAAVVLKD